MLKWTVKKVKNDYLISFGFHKALTYNPKTFRRRKEGREGGEKKKPRTARPRGRGLEPGTCRVLGEGPQLHAMGVV